MLLEIVLLQILWYYYYIYVFIRHNRPTARMSVRLTVNLIARMTARLTVNLSPRMTDRLTVPRYVLYDSKFILGELMRPCFRKTYSRKTIPKNDGI